MVLLVSELRPVIWESILLASALRAAFDVSVGLVTWVASVEVVIV